MSDEPDNIILQHLRAIREEQAVTSAKIGTLAEGMVSMKRRMDGMNERIDGVDNRMVGLDKKIDSLHTDIRIIAIAVDEHNIRLDRIEHRLELIHV